MNLDAQSSLATAIASELLDGRIVQLRGQPGSGRSTVVQLVASELEGIVEVVCVSPAALPADLDRLASDIEAAVESGRPTVCLLDDFGDLLVSEDGAVFQGRLHATATRPDVELAIGILLVGRSSESLSRTRGRLPGSPLAGATNCFFQMLPLEASEIEAALAADGVRPSQVATLVAEYGGHLELISLARSSPSGKAAGRRVERAVFRAVAELSGVLETRVQDLARKPLHPMSSNADDRDLAPIVFHPGPGLSQLAPALISHGLVDLLVSGHDSWPTELEQSAVRFRCRLEAMPDPIWADRHFGSRPAELAIFLERLASSGAVGRLRLLGSSDGTDRLSERDRSALATKFDSVRARGLEVKWRTTTTVADYELIHQRQLVSPVRLSGFALPPSDRILKPRSGGSDTDAVIVTSVVLAMEQAWGRAHEVIGN